MAARLWDDRNIVYRFFADDDRCLYVGMTSNFRHRMAAHRRRSPWAEEVVRTRITLHPTRRIAALAEAEEISRLRPKYNATSPNPASAQDRLLIGAALRTFRNLRGFTPAEMAEQLGISRSYLANIEAGRKALPLNLATVAAEKLNVPPIVFSYFGYTGGLPFLEVV